MKTGIAALVMSAALFMAAPTAMGAPAQAPKAIAQKAGSSAATDLSAGRHHRRSGYPPYYRSYHRPYYYARPYHYRPYPYSAPAPFTFGLGFGPFWW